MIFITWSSGGVGERQRTGPCLVSCARRVIPFCLTCWLAPRGLSGLRGRRAQRVEVVSAKKRSEGAGARLDSAKSSSPPMTDTSPHQVRIYSKQEAVQAFAYTSSMFYKDSGLVFVSKLHIYRVTRAYENSVH